MEKQNSIVNKVFKVVTLVLLVIIGFFTCGSLFTLFLPDTFGSFLLSSFIKAPLENIGYILPFLIPTGLWISSLIFYRKGKYTTSFLFLMPLILLVFFGVLLTLGMH